jgi:hypothetical protein
VRKITSNGLYENETIKELTVYINIENFSKKKPSGINLQDSQAVWNRKMESV